VRVCKSSGVGHPDLIFDVYLESNAVCLSSRRFYLISNICTNLIEQGGCIESTLLLALSKFSVIHSSNYEKEPCPLKNMISLKVLHQPDDDDDVMNSHFQSGEDSSYSFPIFFIQVLESLSSCIFKHCRAATRTRSWIFYRRADPWGSLQGKVSHFLQEKFWADGKSSALRDWKLPPRPPFALPTFSLPLCVHAFVKDREIDLLPIPKSTK